MAKANRLSVDTDEPEEFDEFLASVERPGIADGIEWLFANSFTLILTLVTPWTWFRREDEFPEGEFSSRRGQPIAWRFMNAFEQLSDWFGSGFSFLFDSIELFFINVMAFVRRLLGIR